MLVVNNNYTAKIISIKENHESFFSNKANATVYCHKVIIKVLGSEEEIITQVCESTINQTSFKEGETAQINIVALGKNVYTIKKLIAPEVDNPIIAGTVLHSVMVATAMIYQNRPEVDEVKMLHTADTLYSWAKQKINGK